jgi:hypothetical protein
METQQNRTTVPNRSEGDHQGRGFRSGRVWAGLIVIGVGSILLARQVGADIPGWVISWPSFFIALGLFIGAKHGFKDWGWIILVLIGTTLHSLNFFADDVLYHKLIWPLAIIAVGVIIIFKPRGRERFWNTGREQNRSVTSVTPIVTPSVTPSVTDSGDTAFENVNVFGGAKKVVISKDFRSGELVTIFGGSEINFTQADINGRAEIELVQFFGGTKLIIPPNWTLRSEELVCIFGGVDDKRDVARLTSDPQKVLVLRGTCVFGGIDIRNF